MTPRQKAALQIAREHGLVPRSVVDRLVAAGLMRPAIGFGQFELTELGDARAVGFQVNWILRVTHQGRHG